VLERNGSTDPVNVERRHWDIGFRSVRNEEAHREQAGWFPRGGLGLPSQNNLRQWVTVRVRAVRVVRIDHTGLAVQRVDRDLKQIEQVARPRPQPVPFRHTSPAWFESGLTCTWLKLEPPVERERCSSLGLSSGAARRGVCGR
jgi:hypothetical protein